MNHTITRLLILVCVSLQLLVIATSGFGVERVLGPLAGPIAPEHRQLIAQIHIALMAAGSVCALAVGIWLACCAFSVRRGGLESVGERAVAAHHAAPSTPRSQVVH